MKLYVLRRPDDQLPTYDAAFGFVIRAVSAEEARLIASGGAGDEGKDVWLDPTRTRCEELTQDGDPEVILQDFNAG
jgi:hypothetical protein